MREGGEEGGREREAGGREGVRGERGREWQGGWRRERKEGGMERVWRGEGEGMVKEERVG